MNSFWADFFYDLENGMSKEDVIKWANGSLSEDFNEVIEHLKNYDTKKAIEKLETLKSLFDI